MWQYHNVQLLTSHIHSAMQQLLEVVSSTHINLTTVAWWQSQFNEKLAEKFSEHKSPAGLLITAVLTNSTAIPLAKICQKVNCNIVCNPEYGKHCTKPNSAVSILSVQLYDRERRQNSKHQNEKVAIRAKCSAVSLLVSDGKCATGSDILSWKKVLQSSTAAGLLISLSADNMTPPTFAHQTLCCTIDQCLVPPPIPVRVMGIVEIRGTKTGGGVTGSSWPNKWHWNVFFGYKIFQIPVLQLVDNSAANKQAERPRFFSCFTSGSCSLAKYTKLCMIFAAKYPQEPPPTSKSWLCHWWATAAEFLPMLGQRDGRTDRRTLNSFIDPAPHAMWAVPIIWSKKYPKISCST